MLDKYLKIGMEKFGLSEETIEMIKSDYMWEWEEKEKPTKVMEVTVVPTEENIDEMTPPQMKAFIKSKMKKTTLQERLVGRTPPHY